MLFRAIGARTVLKISAYWHLTHRQHEAILAFFVLARNISHELDDDSSEELQDST